MKTTTKLFAIVAVFATVFICTCKKKKLQNLVLNLLKHLLKQKWNLVPTT